MARSPLIAPHNNWFDDEFGDIKFEVHDYPIGGKLVAGSVTVRYDDFNAIYGSEQQTAALKFDLVRQMVEYMVRNKLVEFTQVDDPSMDAKRVWVRAYLAKDSDVKILRLSKKI